MPSREPLNVWYSFKNTGLTCLCVCPHNAHESTYLFRDAMQQIANQCMEELNAVCVETQFEEAPCDKCGSERKQALEMVAMGYGQDGAVSE